MNDPNISISPQEIEGLFARLQELADELTEPQRALLEAVLKIARDITEPSEQAEQESFDAQFDEAFKPFSAGTADLALAYAVNPPEPGIIVRSAGTSSPPIIVRNPNPPPPPPSPDLDND